MNCATVLAGALALLVATAAGAQVPLFAAKCGASINVDTNPKGQVRLNGKLAKTIVRPDGQISANAAGVWVDIMPMGAEPPRVTFTAKDKSTGNCQILSSAAPAVVAPPRVVGPTHSERAGQGKFDASGTIRCSQSLSGPFVECKAEVARDPGGSASIKVTHADGRTRFIFFENGKALGADLSQADGDMTFKSGRTGDRFTIRAGRERYEIVDAFVFGG